MKGPLATPGVAVLAGQELSVREHDASCRSSIKLAPPTRSNTKGNFGERGSASSGTGSAPIGHSGRQRKRRYGRHRWQRDEPIMGSASRRGTIGVCFVRRRKRALKPR